MSDFETAQWTDEARSEIRAVRSDGTVVAVPADENNADFIRIRDGLPGGQFTPAVLPLNIADPE